MKKVIIIFVLLIIVATIILNYQMIRVTNDSKQTIYRVKLIAANQDLNAADSISAGESRFILTNGKWYALSYSFAFDRVINGDSVQTKTDFWTLNGHVNLKWPGGNFIKISVADTVTIDPLIK